jgi:hypothetical protein
VSLTFVVSQLFPVSVIFPVTLIPVQTASLSSSVTFIDSHHFHISAEFLGTVPFPSQDSEGSESGLSPSLIVGIVLSIVAVMIGVVVGFFFLYRRRGIGSRSSGDADRSILAMDFTDDHTKDADTTFLTTYNDQITDEGDSQIIGSIPMGFAVNLGSPLIV